MVARQTLTLFVWVQILVPQPFIEVCSDMSGQTSLLFYRKQALSQCEGVCFSIMQGTVLTVLQFKFNTYSKYVLFALAYSS